MYRRPATNVTYMFLEQMRSWSDALSICNKLGGILAEMESKGEEEDILQEMARINSTALWVETRVFEAEVVGSVSCFQIGGWDSY